MDMDRRTLDEHQMNIRKRQGLIFCKQFLLFCQCSKWRLQPIVIIINWFLPIMIWHLEEADKKMIKVENSSVLIMSSHCLMIRSHSFNKISIFWESIWLWDLLISVKFHYHNYQNIIRKVGSKLWKINSSFYSFSHQTEWGQAKIIYT